MSTGIPASRAGWLRWWDGSGKVVARVRFTDVFTYRDGRWQALAGHESLLSEASR